MRLCQEDAIFSAVLLTSTYNKFFASFAMMFPKPWSGVDIGVVIGDEHSIQLTRSAC